VVNPLDPAPAAPANPLDQPPGAPAAPMAPPAAAPNPPPAAPQQQALLTGMPPPPRYATWARRRSIPIAIGW